MEFFTENRSGLALKWSRLLGLLLLWAIPAAADPLRVGMELAFAPFEMRDSAGNPAGVSVDLAEALAQSLGRPLEIRNLPFDGLIPALKTGRIDLVISSMTTTEERARSIDFSDPYARTGLCLLVRAADPAAGLSDLDRPGRVLAVKKGSTGHLVAVQTLRAARPLVLDQEAACVLEVVQGKADGFIYDQLSTYRNWRRHPAETRALLAPVREEAWAVGVRKGDEGMRRAVNGFLARFRADGGFERLGNRWLGEEKAEFARLGFPFLF